MSHFFQSFLRFRCHFWLRSIFGSDFISVFGDWILDEVEKNDDFISDRDWILDEVEKPMIFIVSSFCRIAFSVTNPYYCEPII